MSPSFVRDQIDKLPLVAILRGLTPAEAIEIGTALYEAGITVMEVPLNSPVEPLESIRLLSEHFSGKAAVGAGTVLTPKDAERVHAAGGQLIVSPNTNPEVIKRTKELGLHSLPGVATCSECFQAIEAGADGLKIFPASTLGPKGVKDLTAVIPQDVDLFAVGGVNDQNMGEWMTIRIKGVGLGSNLYSPGDSPEEVAKKTHLMLNAFRNATGG
mgnify:CR=1 FL=1